MCSDQADLPAGVSAQETIFAYFFSEIYQFVFILVDGLAEIGFLNKKKSPSSDESWSSL